MPIHTCRVVQTRFGVEACVGQTLLRTRTRNRNRNRNRNCRQKEKASGILSKAFGLGAGGAPAAVAKSAMARGKWGKVSKNIELVVE